MSSNDNLNTLFLVDNIFKKYDSDQNGKLDYNQLAAFLQDFHKSMGNKK